MHEPNSGIVSVTSQTCRKESDHHRVDFNHFEVLLADPVIDLAHDFLFAEQPVMAEFQFEQADLTVGFWSAR
jgi:hypothetical protein